MKIHIIAFSFLFFSFTYLSAAAISTIDFSGFTWDVKSGIGLGPVPNNWTNDSQYLFVDSNGYLHMPIKKINGEWYCSEIIAQQSFGFGEYKVVLGTNVENLDKNIVAGFFTYENDTNEIDIEFSRWGDSSNDDGWYTVQPIATSSQRIFPLNLNSALSKHKYVWNADSVAFYSFHGDSVQLPSNSIQRWVYKGYHNPPAGSEKFHLNFWLFEGNAPSNGSDAELIVKSVSISNSTYKETLTPDTVNSLGAQWKIDDGEWYNSDTIVYVSAGNHVVKYKDIQGYVTPSDKNISIPAKTVSESTTSYSKSQVTAVTPDTIDFEIVGNTWDWHLYANGDAQDPSNFTITYNPDTGGINTSANCAKLVVNDDASRWAGVWTTDMDTFTVNNSNKIVKVMVYKNVITPFKLSFLTKYDQDKGLDGLVLEHTNTSTDQWEELSFDLSSFIDTTFVQMNVMPDFPDDSRSAGSIDYWDNISFSSSIVTSLQIPKIRTVVMFPNPVKDILHFESKNITKVIVRDLVGRTMDVNNINFSGSSIDMSKLPAGSYFITLFKKDGNYTTQKIIKL